MLAGSMNPNLKDESEIQPASRGSKRLLLQVYPWQTSGVAPESRAQHRRFDFEGDYKT
jgi:hypothetical protein